MASESSPQTFSPAERISQLSQIDNQIASLLSLAGAALQSLTNPSDSETLEASKTSFQNHVSEYFATLSSVDVNLRRQIYALQEAGLIQEGSARDARDAARGSMTGIHAGGDMGALDPSWLNSRAKDRVGKGMEEELWSKARSLTEQLPKQNISDSGTDNQVSDEAEDAMTDGDKGT